MYCRSFLLLLTLFAVTVISQDDDQCLDAALALSANQPCSNAVDALDEFTDSNKTITMEILNAYCTPSCRALNDRGLSACANFTVDTTQLYCTVYEGMSCYDVADTFSDGMPQNEILEAQIRCAIEFPTDSAAQTCSPRCMTVVQNFINAGGCCYVENLKFIDQLANTTAGDGVGDLVAACPNFNNRIDNTCQVIGESMTGPGDQGEDMRSAGIVTTGNMLIGSIIVMVSLVLNSL